MQKAALIRTAFASFRSEHRRFFQADLDDYLSHTGSTLDEPKLSLIHI